MLFASSEDLKRAVQRGSHFFQSYAFKTKPLPKWENIIENLNVNKKHINWIGSGGGLCTKINNSLPGMFWLNNIQEAVDKNFKFDGKETTGHLYFSLTSESETFGLHKDTADVFFCGIIGNTYMNVYTHGKDNAYRPYRIGPGDLLFIPKGMYHESKPQGPRVSFSVGVEYGRG
tara:strand:- start:120 stop:641 length:522 start_codon:yes stop_codon:yes gene_type:complete